MKRNGGQHIMIGINRKKMMWMGLKMAIILFVLLVVIGYLPEENRVKAMSNDSDEIVDFYTYKLYVGPNEWTTASVTCFKNGREIREASIRGKMLRYIKLTDPIIAMGNDTYPITWEYYYIEECSAEVIDKGYSNESLGSQIYKDGYAYYAEWMLN